jgi:hypothetical protein
MTPKLLCAAPRGESPLKLTAQPWGGGRIGAWDRAYSALSARVTRERTAHCLRVWNGCVGRAAIIRAAGNACSTASERRRKHAVIETAAEFMRLLRLRRRVPNHASGTEPTLAWLEDGLLRPFLFPGACRVANDQTMCACRRRSRLEARLRLRFISTQHRWTRNLVTTVISLTEALPNSPAWAARIASAISVSWHASRCTLCPLQDLFVEVWADTSDIANHRYSRSGHASSRSTIWLS